MNYPQNQVPVLPTGELVVFPGPALSLFLTDGEVSDVLRAAQANQSWVLALASIDSPPTDGPESLAKLGSIGKISSLRRTKKGTLIRFEASERFQVTDLRREEGNVFAEGHAVLDKEDADESTLISLRENLQTTTIEVLGLFPSKMSAAVQHIKRTTNTRELSHMVAQYMGLSRTQALEVLQITSLKARVLKLLELLVSRREELKVQEKITETLSENVGKRHREALLREQMKAIQDELEEDTDGPTGQDYRKRIMELSLPEDAKKVALREVGRLERMGDQSAETHVIRNYLDLLCDMPWNSKSTAEIDVVKAEAILNHDHFGLDKIKTRILEHLSVMKLMPEKRGSILLFVGPPGVGKTSLGKSVAEALGREFVRISLGGVRDDADVRGHRRTYVGALPGRIIDGIRRAKTKDPVFVLDEIDKLGRGQGDPASALLEVLDPEQNGKFHDHYLDVPFDLSEVVFIGTANSRDTIPGPLLDRMEIIDLSGYTSEEKFHIAKEHLLPAELKSHGIAESRLSVDDEALQLIISGYTREAGVRSLRRSLAAVLRAGAKMLATSPDEKVLVSVESLPKMLGAVKFEDEELNENTDVGVVTGMAWTPVGGDVLFIEAADIPGNGKVVVTGQLGDVMKESSQLAVAVARNKLDGIAPSVLLPERDIHIHVPAGGIPKDGPSAGVTMFTTVASMMLRRPVNPKLAMTGELTLRGKVLPVGGIKEKVLAAVRFGATEILLPIKNKKDLEELPESIRNTVKFHLVSNVDEVLDIVFGPLTAAFEPQSYGAEIRVDHLFSNDVTTRPMPKAA